MKRRCQKDNNMEIHFDDSAEPCITSQGRPGTRSAETSRFQSKLSMFNCWLQRKQLPTISSKSTNAILKDVLLPRSAKTHSVIVTIYKE